MGRKAVVEPEEPETEAPPVAKRKLTAEEKLERFIIVSLVAHAVALLLWFGGSHLYNYIQEIRAQAEREARERAAKEVADSKKKAEEIKREQTKKDLVDEKLLPTIENLLQDTIPDAKIKELMDQALMDQSVQDALDHVAELEEMGADQTDIDHAVEDLEKQLLNSMNEIMQGNNSRQVTKDYLEMLKNGGLEKLANDYKQDLEKKIAQPLAKEADKEVKDEQTMADKERKAVKDALDAAQKEADKAAKDLGDAKDRIAKAMDKAGAQATDAQKAAETAAKNAAPAIDGAMAQLKNAATALDKANTEAPAGAPKNDIAAAKQNDDTAVKDTGAAKNDATAGKPAETALDAGNAAKDAKNLSAAIDKAMADVDAAPGDAKAKADAKADLANAKKQADAAAAALNGVKDNMDKAVAAANASAKTDAATAQAVKNEQGNIDRAEKELANAEAALKQASNHSAAFGDALKSTIDNTADQGAKTAEKQADTAKNDAAKGDAAAAKTDAAAAADKAKDLSNQIAQAKDAADKAAFDPAALARAALKDVRDTDLKGMLDQAFNKSFTENALPRITEKAKKALKDDLAQNGVTDDATVNEAMAEVDKLLREKVPELTKAGETGTKDMTKSQNLDAANAKDTEKNATEAKGIENKFKKAASDLIAKEMNEVTKDGTHDADAMPHPHGPHGKLSDSLSGKENANSQLSQSMAQAMDRIAQAAANAKAGRMGMLDMPGSDGGARMAQLKQRAMERGQGFSRLSSSQWRFDKDKYEEYIKDIVSRDKNDARGKAQDLKGAEGTASEGESDKDMAKAATLLMPPETEKPAESKADKADAYKPTFVSRKFAVIPFIPEPMKLDLNAEKWKDIPSLKIAYAHGDSNGGGLKIVSPQNVKMCWDHAGLYMYMDVIDPDNKIAKVTKREFWLGDGIEIFIDAMNAKDPKRGASWTQQFWVWPFGSDKNANVWGGEAKVKADGDGVFIQSDEAEWKGPHIQRAAKPTPQGWQMEVFVPAGLVNNLDLKPGRIIGFDLSICGGNSIGKDVYFYWAVGDVQVSTHPATWGDIMMGGSDGKVELPEKLGSELAQGEVLKPARGLVIGEPLKVRVTDMDMDLHPTSKDKVSVTVSTRTGEKQVMILEETGVKTGVFEGSLSTTLSTGDSQPGKLSLYEGDEITVTYTDQARGNGSKDVPVKLSLKTAASTQALGN